MTTVIPDEDLDDLIRWARSDILIFIATIEKFPPDHVGPRPGEHYPDGTDEPLEWQLDRTVKLVTALSELRYFRDQIEAQRRCEPEPRDWR
jgi:hypothetical protein